MTPERWQQIERLYHAALACEPARRPEFLAQACAGDKDLLNEVASLLAHEQQGQHFIETPAIQMAAESLATELIQPVLGRTLGCYEILAPLGAGGMGEVYRAKDTSLGREVAVKVLPPAFSRDPERLRRFEQEARAAGMLNHPNILTIYAVGNHEGSPYLVTELLEGETLRGRLSGQGLTPRKASDYALEIARGLAAAHEKGIVHRDLKPENVFVTKDGRIKILDFGLAKLTQEDGAEEPMRTESGVVLGTVGYMSPEQVRGQPADQRADIFAFGAILYEMLSGQRAFQRSSRVESMNAILKEEPPRFAAGAGVAPALERILWRCLEKRPEERFGSARDLGFALEALSDLSSPAIQPEAPEPRWSRGRKRLAWGLTAIVLITAVAAGVSTMLRDRRQTLGGPKVSTGARASQNVEANEYFEKAVMFLRVQNDLPRARQMLERALQEDPKFAEARRWYGFTHVLMIDGGHSNDTSWLYKAEEELRRAARDDPSLASVHSALAAVYLHQGKKELVPVEAEKCLKALPNDPEALVWLVEYHRLNGDNTAALALLKGLIEREPLFFPARMSRGEILRSQGDTAGAIREQEKILEQAPDNLYGLLFLSRAYLTAGQLTKARGIMERGRSVDAKNYPMRVGWALLLALEGKREEALKEMNEEVLKFAAAHLFTTSEAAEFYAVLGDVTKALDWLDRAVRNGDDRSDWFRRNPLLANVRQHPRFQQIEDSIAYRRKPGAQ